jgi:hypothetical protein
MIQFIRTCSNEINMSDDSFVPNPPDSLDPAFFFASVSELQCWRHCRNYRYDCIFGLSRAC